MKLTTTHPPIVTTGITVVDPQGRPRIELTVAPDGTSTIALRDKHGRLRLDIGLVESASDPPPTILLLSADDEVRLSLGVYERGPCLRLDKSDEENCISLAVRDDQAEVCLGQEVAP